MFVEKLANNINSNEQFQAEFQSLCNYSLALSVGIQNAAQLENDVIVRLLNVAGHFASTTSFSFRKLANEIAVHVSKIDNNKHDYANSLSIIWTKLGNFPTKSFILNDSDDDNLPTNFYFQNKYREFENTIHLKNTKEIILTDFQAEVWKSLESNPTTTITGPTSSGKSFSLMNYLINTMSSSETFIACYIVPTRALINQVTNSLSKTCAEFSILDGNFLITSVPTARNELRVKKIIYVITQERLQVLFNEDENIVFDFVIIDEAQMVGDSSRGIILHSMIEQVRTSSPNAKILFGSPFTKNPSIFETVIGGAGSIKIVESEETPVLQNLILVDSNQTDSKTVKISRLSGPIIKEVGVLNIGLDLIDPRLNLAYIAYSLGKNERNLIYVDGPAEGERVSSLISQLIEDDNIVVDDAIVKKRIEFSNFLKEHVHPDYILADTVLNGVAFHYGNMPTVVRKTIESYFDDGLINYLVCTSTLLHGVNFPAKNLFIEKPERGDGKPLSSVDFWNLAGRAGRLGKDYEGNVFLIDLKSWQQNPLIGERLQEIKPSYFTVLKTNQTEMFDFIADSDHGSGKRDMESLETTFQKLLKDKDENNLNNNLLKVFGSEQDENFIAYKNNLADAVKKITLPSSIYKKHSNISAYRQQELYDYLVKSIKTKGPETYLLKHPMQEKSYESYVFMLRRIRLKIEKIPGPKGSEHYFGPLMTFWMNGTPLAAMIRNYHGQKMSKSKRGRVNIATSIRECLENIEKVLRFKLVKFTRCYTDILVLALKETGHENLVKSIPNISLYLELGASSKSMVNLIGLGLSRTTASIVNEKMAKKDLDQLDCIIWLKKNNLAGMGIPDICINEIKNIIRF